MNWIKVCEISFKVITAAVAGVAIFVGIDQAVRRGKSGNNSGANNCNQASGGGSGMFGPKIVEPDNPMQHQPPSGAFPVERSNGQKVLDGLKGATSMCSKLLSFAQSLTSLAENFSRIFKDSPDNFGGYGGYNCYPPGYGGGWNDMGGQSWRRISPFVIEAAPSPKYNPGSQRYPF